MDQEGKGSDEGSEELPQTTKGPPRSIAIAAEGIETAADFSNMMSALMSDLIEGKVTPSVGNATCNAGGKLLKVVELQYKYGTNTEDGNSPSLTLAHQRPKKRLEANWPKPKKRLTANRKRDEEVAYDYGDDAGAGLDDWPEFWKWFYYRPPGRPGRSHTSDLPIAPLHAVYSVVRRWWIGTLGGKFNPTYPRAWDGDEGEVGGPRDIIEKFNPAGRLLLLIAREMDDRFTADNVANLRYTGYRRARRARHE